MSSRAPVLALTDAQLFAVVSRPRQPQQIPLPLPRPKREHESKVHVARSLGEEGGLIFRCPHPALSRCTVQTTWAFQRVQRVQRRETAVVRPRQDASEYGEPIVSTSPTNERETTPQPPVRQGRHGKVSELFRDRTRVLSITALRRIGERLEVSGVLIGVEQAHEGIHVLALGFLLSVRVVVALNELGGTGFADKPRPASPRIVVGCDLAARETHARQVDALSLTRIALRFPNLIRIVWRGRGHR